MSYTRANESGFYIYPTLDGVEFVNSEVIISNEEINVFLYKLYTFREDEFFERVDDGRQIIQTLKKEMSENDKNK